jgi:hypothetical protein
LQQTIPNWRNQNNPNSIHFACADDRQNTPTIKQNGKLKKVLISIARLVHARGRKTV